jgi:hypothetical protein
MARGARSSFVDLAKKNHRTKEDPAGNKGRRKEQGWQGTPQHPNRETKAEAQKRVMAEAGERSSTTTRAGETLPVVHDVGEGKEKATRRMAWVRWR